MCLFWYLHLVYYKDVVGFLTIVLGRPRSSVNQVLGCRNGRAGGNNRLGARAFRRGGLGADLLLTRFALGLLQVGRCNPNALLVHEKTGRVHGEPRPAGPTAGLTRQPRHDQFVFLP